MTTRAPIDPEGLLVALVLSPATYSRNRFFEMYKDPLVRRVRRRAAHIRSVVRQVTAPDGEPRFSPAAEDRVELGYEVPSLGLRRTVLLDPIELSLVRFAMARARDAGAPPPGDPDRVRVEEALARLAPTTSAHAG